jgi:hypothetical protein
MSGIAKLDNKVSVDGSFEPYGGSVIDLQYSISFEGSSTLTITVVNAKGTYKTPELNSSTPVEIRFGHEDKGINVWMLAVSFKKSLGGAKGRTMTVTYDDMGLKHLDKNVVLLKNQHLTNANLTPCTIVLGKDFKPNAKGVLIRWHGGWKPEGISVLYDIKDLADGIRNHNIPISDRFYEFLIQFTAYDHGGADDPCVVTSFLRSDSGTLRGIVETVSGMLGVIPFWNNSKENGNGPEGCLDFLFLPDGIDKDKVQAAIDRYATSCNVEDDAYEVTIKNSFLQGGVGSFSVNPDRLLGGKTTFKRIKFRDYIKSPYTDKKVTIKGNYEINLLMRAAVLGADFYHKYVLSKLIAAYAKKQVTKDKTAFGALYLRDQGEEDDIKKFSFVDQVVMDEGGEANPFNIKPNKVVEDLYMSDGFEMMPAVYTKNFDFRGKWNVLGDMEVGGQLLLDKEGEELGADSKYYTLLDDDSFMGELRSTNVLDSTGKETSEFIGVLVPASSGAMMDFIEEPGSDPIYSELLFMAENYGRFYAAKSLVTGKLFNARRYSEDVRAYFSDLAIVETPLSPLWSRYKTTDKPVKDEELWETGEYRLNWGGTAECGYKILPKGTIVLPKRTMNIENAYKNIVTIYSYCKSGADAKPKKVSCTNIQKDVDIPTFRTINDGEYGKTSNKKLGLFKFESYSIRTDRDLHLEQSCKKGVDDFCVLIGKGQLGGKGKSVTSDQYALINSRRQDCDRPQADDYQHAVAPSSRCNPSSQRVIFTLPTDNDAMVPLYDKGGDYEVGKPDTAIASTLADPPNSLTNEDSYWNDDDFLFGIESINWPVETKPTSWKPQEMDYWDLQLMHEVQPSLDIRNIKDTERLSYSYHFLELLQGLRSAYIPAKDFHLVSKITVEDIEFDIAQLLSVLQHSLEYEICDDKSYLNLPEAEKNLVRIMQSYVEANTSPSIVRDLVVSGLGFKSSLNAAPSLPTIEEGLESMSVAFNDNGIHTTIKMGNKRRSRFSAQLQSEMIVRGMAGSPSARRVPNRVAGSFGVGIQTRM